MWFLVAVAATAVTMAVAVAVAVSVVATLNPKPQFAVAEKFTVAVPQEWRQLTALDLKKAFGAPANFNFDVSGSLS